MNYLVLGIGISIVSLVMVRLGLAIHQALSQMRSAAHTDRLWHGLLEQKIASTKRQYEKASVGWNGYRKFAISAKQPETNDICSFYLTPHDGKSISAFRPGQYLTIQLNIPGREKPVVRCYSLSDSFKPEHYRITIKRALPPHDDPTKPAGLVSNYFHEQLDVGDIVDLQAPSGNFSLDPTQNRHAVLIAGGVGITPIINMAKSIVASNSNREITVFYGVRNGREHAFQGELRDLAQNPNCRVITCYSAAEAEDHAVEGTQFQHHGWVSAELIRSYLESTNYEFYICGPPAMMKMLPKQLVAWGAAKANIHTEAFGPATVKNVVATASCGAGQTANSPACQVTFAKSGLEVAWDPAMGNLLELAHAHGVEIASGCRAGNCGTCSIAIKSGSVDYQTEPGELPEKGSCLTCIANPQTHLVLDA